MKDCVCGKSVRLGGMKIRSPAGVIHHIVHMDGTKVCVPGDWTAVMLKPYPKHEADKPWVQMVQRWNEA